MIGSPLNEIMARKGDLVRAALRPSLRLLPCPESSGRSRIGGARMLARPGEVWPVCDDNPLALLAQVDFAECAGLIGGLPATGILQALIHLDELPVMGESDLANGAARLRIMPDADDLRWIESGLDTAGYPVDFEIVQTLPDGDIDGLDDHENEFVSDTYWAEGHRVLGYPTSIQYDPFDYPENYNPNGNRVLALQIDGDPRLGWHWVDQGILHFLTDGRALAEGRIEDALFDMQLL